MTSYFKHYISIQYSLNLQLIANDLNENNFMTALCGKRIHHLFLKQSCILGFFNRLCPYRGICCRIHFIIITSIRHPDMHGWSWFSFSHDHQSLNSDLCICLDYTMQPSHLRMYLFSH